MQAISVCGLLIVAFAALWGQAPAPGKATAPFQSRSASAISYSVKDGEETVNITNVAYELADDSAAGLPAGSRLVLRSTTRSKEILGDKGVEATVTLEAWPFGADLQGKARYVVKVSGVGAQTVQGGLWIVDRATDPDVRWWSIYNLATGRHLFDTYVELLRFSISRETLTERYAGLDVPPDNTPDARLKEPHTVAILVYASQEKVLRETLITCDDRERAALLRSYADTSRQLALVEGAGGHQALRISISTDYPSPPKTAVISIPIAKDDLDLAHAELPPGLHATAFRR